MLSTALMRMSGPWGKVFKIYGAFLGVYEKQESVGRTSSPARVDSI